MSSTPILNSTVVRAKFGVVHQMGFARRRILRKIVRANLDPDLGVHAGEFCEQENCARRFGGLCMQANSVNRKIVWVCMQGNSANWKIVRADLDDGCACRGILRTGKVCSQIWMMVCACRGILRTGKLCAQIWMMVCACRKLCTQIWMMGCACRGILRTGKLCVQGNYARRRIMRTKIG